MACYDKSQVFSDGDTAREAAHKKPNKCGKKSPIFVPVDGLSQSAKDRLMNNRTVRPPKNINLVEGDPVDRMEFPKTRETQSFPNEYALAAKIKEVNGMDFSNHFIEQHYRRSQSVSPEISEDSTNSSSMTNDSVRYGLVEFQEESNTESNHPDCNKDNTEYDSNFVGADSMDDAIRNCRYSKNAAIIGLLKTKIISMKDLELQYSPDNKDMKIIENKKTKENSTKEFEPKVDKTAAYPQLVPHPEDPEFFAHPLQAYGEVDDAGIDFTLPRRGAKTTITPRQFFIREGLNDEKFQFQRQTNVAPKPKFNYNFSTNSRSQTPRNQSQSNSSSNNSFDSTNENDGFRINHDEFPMLQ